MRKIKMNCGDLEKNNWNVKGCRIEIGKGW